jgi:antitoxin PrlF
MMNAIAAKLTAKGQVTIPAEIRSHLQLSDGDHVDFYSLRSGEIRLLRRNRPATDLFGMAAAFTKPLDDEARIADIANEIAQGGKSNVTARSKRQQAE